MKKPKINNTGFILLLGAIVILWVLSIIVLKSLFPEIDERGQFGDTFGAINALFSGGAFAGVIYAIILQRQELSLQRKELELTRKELKRTAEAQEKSEKALSKQAESLKVTAVLNGLSSMLSHYDMMSQQGARQNSPTLREAENALIKIKNIVDSKSIL